MIAWIVVLCCATLWIWSHRVGEGATPGSELPASVSSVDELTGKIVIGGKAAAKDAGLAPGMLLAQAKPLKDGTDIQRIAYAILAADLEGPEQGLARLDEVLSQEDLPQATRDLGHAVAASMVAWHGGKPTAERSLSIEDADRLGFFARVLDGSVEPSAGVVMVLLGVAAWYLLIGLAGLVALIVLLVLFALGMQRRFGATTLRGPVYIETFAVWIVLFFGLSLVLATILAELGWGGLALVVSPLAFLASLLALAWPVIRGVPWSDVRRDIGWHAEAGVVKEFLLGFPSYALALPLMGLGVLAFLGLSKLSGQAPQPSHPAVENITDAGGLELLGLFVVACIAAPIVEETMFRGVLYRHLRDSTALLGSFVSVAVATVVSSTLFAAIHPQGFFFVPILAGLATGFCLVREWRGSLLPGMLAHAITNFVTLGMNVVLGLM